MPDWNSRRYKVSRRVCRLKGMACVLCNLRDRCNEKALLHLLPATADMGVLLEKVLADHSISFERDANLLTLRGVAHAGRVVALLRQVMSGPERQAVSVLNDNGRDFPVARSLDEWWRVFETGWFERALRESRFETWFQPIVDTHSHELLAHECLIRLNMGRIYNGGEIVEAAIVRNEMHALDSHARQLAIRSAAMQSRHGKYFVNFMPSSVYNPEFCMISTLDALTRSSMPAANIVFEVVESDLVRDPAHLRKICDFYRRHGFGFALDDVGTGSNSLQMVCDLKPDYIKLDKSLIQNVEQPMYGATIRKLVELAEQFGVQVIAEGVERLQTVENLWLLGVRYMQGYLFGRPAPQVLRTHEATAVEETHQMPVGLAHLPGMAVPMAEMAR